MAASSLGRALPLARWSPGAVLGSWDHLQNPDAIALPPTPSSPVGHQASHSIVFLYFFALITEAVSSLLAILWNSTFRWVYLSFSPLLFASLFSAICKASLFKLNILLYP